MYPQKYYVMSRNSLLQLTPSSDIAVIFIHGNLKTDLDVPKTYYQALSHIKKFGTSLQMAIDDLCEDELSDEDIEHYQPYFITDNKIQQIDKFLRQNNNKTVIISCVAGISRSGAVGWYLDQRNHRDDNWSYKIYDNVKRPINDTLFPHLDMYRKFRDLL